jgi:hypothetical protein
MRMPGFTAEISLYQTNEHYQGLTAAQTNGPGVQMAYSSGGRVFAKSNYNFPFPVYEPIGCYLDDLSTDCSIVSECLQAGTCEVVYYQF